MLRTRVLSSVLMGAIILYPVWAGGLWFLALAVTIGLLAGWEFYRLSEKNGYHPATATGLVCLTVLILSGYFPHQLRLEPLLTLLLMSSLILALWGRGRKPATDWAITIAGALYLGMLLRFFPALREQSDGFDWLLYALLITWITDSGAYFIGTAIGRHPLWPRLSPKKTWEGAIGGWIVGVVASAGLALFLTNMNWFQGLILGAIVSLAAPFGDLAESMFKRQAGAKDSSHLIPGHGGALDRIDSLLFVVPVVYYWANWLF
ncbi:MAG TPA: phosphatidate cytidylyltransferase [Anaerolineae bacterium]|nr:phosphatidate cytidylyltransferase [Anaerolineae bacterium]